jgi:hypothetical protein
MSNCQGTYQKCLLVLKKRDKLETAPSLLVTICLGIVPRAADEAKLRKKPGTQWNRSES